MKERSENWYNTEPLIIRNNLPWFRPNNIAFTIRNTQKIKENRSVLFRSVIIDQFYLVLSFSGRRKWENRPGRQIRARKALTEEAGWTEKIWAAWCPEGRGFSMKCKSALMDRNRSSGVHYSITHTLCTCNSWIRPHSSRGGSRETRCISQDGRLMSLNGRDVWLESVGALLLWKVKRAFRSLILLWMLFVVFILSPNNMRSETNIFKTHRFVLIHTDTRLFPDTALLKKRKIDVKWTP